MAAVDHVGSRPAVSVMDTSNHYKCIPPVSGIDRSADSSDGMPYDIDESMMTPT